LSEDYSGFTIEELDAEIEALEERAKAAFGMGRDNDMRLFFRKAQALKSAREKLKTSSATGRTDGLES
jgi:hypothetical protein